MKRFIFIGLLLTVIQLQAKHRKLDLQKAVDMRLVKAKASSLGGYQGYCINMSLRNLSGDSLIVIVEAGRRLNSVEDKFQDILVVKEELIVLRKSEEKNFKVKGYCCQSSNCAPGKNSVYDINKMADSSLVKVARFLNRNCFNQGVEQQAIWAVSDGKPTAGISENNDTTLLPLRQLVSNIKGEKLPWYTLLCGTYVYDNGRIINYPIALKGKISYSNSSDDYVTLYVYNEKGQQVCLVKSQWMKPGSNLEYNLDIPVKNLAKGKYTIALKTPQKELASKEFEI